MTRQNTSIIDTPTPVKTIRLIKRANQHIGTDTVKNQLIGMEAIRASPPQLRVTSAASSVVLARSREPVRLFRMYRAGNGKPQAMPAAAVHNRAQTPIRWGPP